MATTVYATVTVTATVAAPPITVREDCVSTTLVTKDTRNKDLGLYLFPPFTAAAESPSTSLNAIGASAVLLPSPPVITAAGVPDGNLSFPHGLPPRPPLPDEPLALGNSPYYYGPGVTLLLLAISLAACLQAWIPHERRLALPHFAFLGPRLTGSLRWSKTSPESPKRLIATAVYETPLVALSLAGMNIAAWDLLRSTIAMERQWKGGDAEAQKLDQARHWIASAALMGAPFSILAWNIVPAIIRSIVGLVQVRSHRQKLKTNKSAKQAARLAARQLAVESLGLLLPATMFMFLATRPWLYAGIQTTSSRALALYPQDFLPALYWNGMNGSFHGMLLALFVAVGAAPLLVAALLLLIWPNWDDLVAGHAGLTRRIGIDPWTVLQIGFSFGSALLFATWLVAQIMVSLAGGAGQQSLDAVTNYIGWFYVRALIVLAVVLVPILLTVYIMLLFLPTAFLYAIMAFVFRSIDAQKSCFFVPCARRASAWDMDQLSLTMLGLGLVVYHVWLIRQNSAEGSSRVTGARGDGTWWWRRRSMQEPGSRGKVSDAVHKTSPE